MPRWILLTYQLPASPSAVRVAIWRRLQTLGAVAIKNSIYILPDLSGTREDFEWLRRQIIERKGEATIFAADNLSGVEAAEIVRAFQKARAKDFENFIDEATELRGALNAALRGSPIKGGALDRLERRWTGLKMDWERLQKIDFFKNPNRTKSEALVAALQKRLQEAKRLSLQTAPEPPSAVDTRTLKDKVWVTRKSPHIDRLACAWLVRRKIDPKARLKFVSEPYTPRKGELRFDMAEGEFTHFGDCCSFETFLYRLGLKETALKELAEIIHDIDLKDRKFGRLEAPGLSQIVRGLCKIQGNDFKRVQAGVALFDAFYAALDSRRRA